MRIGLSTISFIDTPVTECLDTVSEHFDRMEITSEGKHDIAVFLDTFKVALPSYSLRFSVHAPYNGVNIAHTDSTVRDAALARLESTIAAAAALDIALVTIHPGSIPRSGFCTLAEIQRLNADALRRLASCAEEHGVTLCLENMPAFDHLLCQTAEELFSLIDNSENRLGVTFDVGHAHTHGAVGAFLASAHRFTNIHLHDNKGVPFEDPHLPIGEGTIDFSRVFAALAGHYAGDVIIEAKKFEEGVQSKAVVERFMQPC